MIRARTLFILLITLWLVACAPQHDLAEHEVATGEGTVEAITTMMATLPPTTEPTAATETASPTDLYTPLVIVPTDQAIEILGLRSSGEIPLAPATDKALRSRRACRVPLDGYPVPRQRRCGRGPAPRVPAQLIGVSPIAVVWSHEPPGRDHPTILHPSLESCFRTGIQQR